MRVVKLFAAAIDHSVSPGCTVCGTAAVEGAAKRSANSTAYSGVSRKGSSLLRLGVTPRGLPVGSHIASSARGLTCPCMASCGRGRPQTVGPEVALVPAQQPALEPRPHPLRVRKAPVFCKMAAPRRDPRAAQAKVASRWASTSSWSRMCGSRAPATSTSAAAASSTSACRWPRWTGSRSASTACSPTAASSPTATTASTTPTSRSRGRASPPRVRQPSVTTCGAARTS